MAAVKALCKFSSHNSAGVTQSVCVCVVFIFFFIFLLFFPKVGSHTVLQPLYQTSFQTAPSRC